MNSVFITLGGVLMKKCDRCGCSIRSYSPMRKWCVDCRKEISLEQAKERKYNNGRKRKNIMEQRQIDAEKTIVDILKSVKNLK